jgi:hypothetical protein
MGVKRKVEDLPDMKRAAVMAACLAALIFVGWLLGAFPA